VAEPEEMADATPVDEDTVTADGLVLYQLPPEMLSLKLVVDPMHKLGPNDVMPDGKVLI
jgi:hypothetical protein